MTSVDSVSPGRAALQALDARRRTRRACSGGSCGAARGRCPTARAGARGARARRARRGRGRATPWRGAGGGWCSAGARGSRDLARDQAEQVRELRLVGVVALGRGQRGIAEAVDGLPQEQHLARAGVDEAAHLVDHLARRAVALRPARVRHDAEGAALVAALHRGDEGHDGRPPRLGRRREEPRRLRRRTPCARPAARRPSAPARAPAARARCPGPRRDRCA